MKDEGATARRALRILAVGNVYPPHHLQGGYEVIWHGAMRHLREDGHAVRVLASDYRRPNFSPAAQEDPDVHRELRWYWRDHQWLELGPLQRLALERANAGIFDRHLREFRPDVIAWWSLGGLSLSLVERARRRRVPSVFFVFDYWPSYGPERDLWTRMWRARPRLAAVAERLTGVPARLELGNAGRWVFCSASMRDETLATGLLIPDQTIAHAGVAEPYTRAPRESDSRPWRWRLLYVGRVVEQKGVRTAIEALAQLPAEATLRIVGEGDPPYRAELQQTAADLGIGHRVQFEPPRAHQQLLEVYRAADAVVFPVQWAEPWGLVPLEAMSLGRPVVATGRGGSADYLRDGENALLFESGDAGSLAAALRRLASDAPLRERIRAGGYETASHHHSDDFNRRATAELEAAVRRSSTPRPRR